MRVEAEAPEFPFVAQLAKRAKSKFDHYWEAKQALVAAQEKHGALIPRSMVAALLGLSQQRVSQICEDGQGRLVVVQVGSQKLITSESLDAFCKLERKAGRPAGPTTAKQLMGVVVKESVRAFCERRDEMLGKVKK